MGRPDSLSSAPGSTPAHRSILWAIGLALLSFQVAPALAQKAKDMPTPRPGDACPTLGATARAATGARLDCVKAGTASQWHVRGSRPNPFAWGETARVATEYATWNITVDSVDPDITARLLAVDERNPRPRPGSKYVGLHLTLSYVGQQTSERVRQGVNLKALGAQGTGIDRWIAGATTADDCWANESVDRDGIKKCMMPFEISAADAQIFKFYAAKVVGTPVVYFSGTPTR